MNKTLIAIGSIILVSIVMLYIGLSGLITIFDWPDILKAEPITIMRSYSELREVIPIYWFLTGFSAIFMTIPIVLFGDVVKTKLEFNNTISTLGVLGGLLSGIGFLRWIFPMPALADAFSSVTAEGLDVSYFNSAFIAINAFGGAEIGEFLGQFFLGLWMLIFSISLFRAKILPRWFSVWGMFSGSCFALSSAEVVNEASISWFPYWSGFTSLGYLAFIWMAVWGVLIIIPEFNKKISN